jgi:hypothetical protein
MRQPFVVALLYALYAATPCWCDDGTIPMAPFQQSAPGQTTGAVLAEDSDSHVLDERSVLDVLLMKRQGMQCMPTSYGRNYIYPSIYQYIITICD